MATLTRGNGLVNVPVPWSHPGIRKKKKQINLGRLIMTMLETSRVHLGLIVFHFP